MTHSRRSLLAAGATGTIALTAGCLGFVLGNEPLEFAADRVAPTDEMVAETGYEERAVEQRTMERSEGIGGIERDFEASLWTSSYSKSVDYMGQTREGSVFTAVSVPGMEVAGQSVNPLDEMSNEELLEEFLGRSIATVAMSTTSDTRSRSRSISSVRAGTSTASSGSPNSMANRSTWNSHSRRSITRTICSCCSAFSRSVSPRNRRTSNY